MIPTWVSPNSVIVALRIVKVADGTMLSNVSLRENLIGSPAKLVLRRTFWEVASGPSPLLYGVNLANASGLVIIESLE
jgi:hypothetical protein